MQASQATSSFRTPTSTRHKSRTSASNASAQTAPSRHRRRQRRRPRRLPRGKPDSRISSTYFLARSAVAASAASSSRSRSSSSAVSREQQQAASAVAAAVVDEGHDDEVLSAEVSDLHASAKKSRPHKVRIRRNFRDARAVCARFAKHVTDVYARFQAEASRPRPQAFTHSPAPSVAAPVSSVSFDSVLGKIEKVHRRMLLASEHCHSLEVQAAQLHEQGFEALVRVVRSLLSACWSASSAAWACATLASLHSFDGATWTRSTSGHIDAFVLAFDAHALFRLAFEDLLKTTHNLLKVCTLWADELNRDGELERITRSSSHEEVVLQPPPPGLQPLQVYRVDRTDSAAPPNPDLRSSVRRVFFNADSMKKQASDLQSNLSSLKKESARFVEYLQSDAVRFCDLDSLAAHNSDGARSAGVPMLALPYS